MKKLEDYINAMKEKGFSDDAIKSKLQEGGWKEEHYSMYFEPVVPKPGEEVNIPRPNDNSNIPRPEQTKKFEDEGPYHLSDKRIIVGWINGNIGILILYIVIFILYFVINPNHESLLDYLENLIYAPIFIIVLSIFQYIYMKFEYKYYKYSFKEGFFQKEKGIIAKKFVSIPYDQIQNIDITQDFIDRIFGVYKLDIQTAGNSGMNRYGYKNPEGFLPTLNKDQAESVKNKLFERAEVAKRNRRSR